MSVVSLDLITGFILFMFIRLRAYLNPYSFWILRPFLFIHFYLRWNEHERRHFNKLAISHNDHSLCMCRYIICMYNIFRFLRFSECWEPASIALSSYTLIYIYACDTIKCIEFLAFQKKKMCYCLTFKNFFYKITFCSVTLLFTSLNVALVRLGYLESRGSLFDKLV